MEARREGHGTWQPYGGVKYVGLFEQDKPVGRGKFVFPDGTLYLFVRAYGKF